MLSEHLDSADIQSVRSRGGEEMSMLGVLLEQELQLDARLEQACSRLYEGAAILSRKMNRSGFDIPFKCGNYAAIQRTILTSTLHIFFYTTLRICQTAARYLSRSRSHRNRNQAGIVLRRNTSK